MLHRSNTFLMPFQIRHFYNDPGASLWQLPVYGQLSLLIGRLTAFQHYHFRIIVEVYCSPTRYHFCLRVFFPLRGGWIKNIHLGNSSVLVQNFNTDTVDSHKCIIHIPSWQCIKSFFFKKTKTKSTLNLCQLLECILVKQKDWRFQLDYNASSGKATFA